METLAKHLQHQPSATIRRSELNEVILTVYNILGWALRDQCDTLRLTRHHATWLRGDVPIGQFAESSLQTVTFRSALELILKRDKVVHQHLQRLAEDGDEVTYRITSPTAMTTTAVIAQSVDERR